MAAPTPPPNLRVAESDAKDCGNCEFYKTGGVAGVCDKYGNLPVHADWLCDSWAKDDDSAGPDAEDRVPTEQQPKTLSEARVKVREHFRRARAKAASQS